MPDLLIELFSEEIPARMQRRAGADLRRLVSDALVAAGLTYEGAKEYWTPRRLALDVRGISARSADTRDERKGPRTDAPQKAIDGFLRGAGLLSVDEAQIRRDPKKGEFYVAVIEKPGRDAAEIIAEAMPAIIRDFPWPKSMRWGTSSQTPGGLRWVRPLHSILCLFGPETEEPQVIGFKVGELTAGNTTRGHRFLAPEPITVKRFDDYAEQLERAKVVLDAERRQQMIAADAQNLAFAQGYELVEDEGLLDEVANLVEWPVVLMGEFDEKFLDIPPEVVRLTIRENQKCFVLRKAVAVGETAGAPALTNRFLVIANIEALDGGAEIARGNAKVVNARLADADFFWNNDVRQATSTKGFEPWVANLDQVTFHAKLGSQGERVKRIELLAKELAPLVDADPEMAKRAAHLAKADLQSAMVFEFPEVQGKMGRRYAELAGEDPAVARAIEEHYKPLGPTDDVPAAPVSVAVALADKLDMLVGFWAIDEKPTGSKDPYALRRAALGVIRLVLENRIRLSLLACMTNLAKNRLIATGSKLSNSTANAPREIAGNLLTFFHHRLKGLLRDQGVRHDIIDAVITAQADDLLIIAEKALSLQGLISSAAGADLLVGYRRATNILAAEEKKGTEVPRVVDDGLLSDASEKMLAKAIACAETNVGDAVAREDFSAAMTALAELRRPVDGFFEDVLVNAEDPAVRLNRLALLTRIRAATMLVADFSKIEGS